MPKNDNVARKSDSANAVASTRLKYKGANAHLISDDAPICFQGTRRVLEKPMKHTPWQAVSNRTNTYPIFDAPNCIHCMRRVLEKPMKHAQKTD